MAEKVKCYYANPSNECLCFGRERERESQEHKREREQERDNDAFEEMKSRMLILSCL